MHPPTISEIQKVLPTIEKILLTKDGLGWNAVKSHIKDLISGKSHQRNQLDKFDVSMLLPSDGS